MNPELTEIPEGYMDVEFTIDQSSGTCKSTIIRGGKSKASAEECDKQLKNICDTPVEGYFGEFGEEDGDGFTDEHYEDTRPKVMPRPRHAIGKEKAKKVTQEPKRERMGLGYGS